MFLADPSTPNIGFDFLNYILVSRQFVNLLIKNSCNTHLHLNILYLIRLELNQSHFQYSHSPISYSKAVTKADSNL